MRKNSSKAIAPRRIEAPSQRLSSELIVYDTKRHRGHCLNHTAAAIWMACDGRTTIAEITRALRTKLKSGIDEQVVWMTLTRLKKAGLLAEGTFSRDEIGTLSRREAMRKLGIAGAVALPIITSLVVPTPANALSCFPAGQLCSNNAQCCSGRCGLFGVGPVCLP